MNQQTVEQLARRLLRGELALDEFVRQMAGLVDSAGPPPAWADATAATADLGEVQLDLDRRRRCGYPEVVFGEGKSTATLEKTFHRLLAAGQEVFATRIRSDTAEQLLVQFPAARYNAVARTFYVPASAGPRESEPPAPPERRRGRVVVVTAGTTDLPVAEEAAETLRWMRADVTMIVDVGVAGPHRLPAHLDELRGADAVVVVAGMEGALPSVVGGWVACPVIAVPSSIGYGANFGGLAALLAMLNSCAANVAVVNIDAGFKAGYLAGMIASQSAALAAPP